MVQLEGTYEFASEENYVEYLKSLGLNDEEAQKHAAIKTPIIIKSVAADNITLSYGEKTVTFPVGKEVEQTVSSGHKIWITVGQSGNTITLNTKLSEDGSLTEEKVFTFTDNGLTSSSTNSKGSKFVRRYNRA